MTRYLALDHEASFRERCDSRASALFSDRDELEILRLYGVRGGNGNEEEIFLTAKRHDVINIKQLQELNEVWKCP